MLKCNTFESIIQSDFISFRFVQRGKNDDDVDGGGSRRRSWKAKSLEKQKKSFFSLLAANKSSTGIQF